MAQIKKLQHLLQKQQCIAIDSSIFIYAFEQHPQFEPLCTVVFDLVSTHQLQLVTSAITVSEILVRPYQLDNVAVVQLYQQLFATLPQFTIIDVNYALAETAAYVRAKHNLTLPDAIQIATALQHEATVFVTNDLKLKRSTELDIICLKDYT